MRRFIPTQPLAAILVGIVVSGLSGCAHDTSDLGGSPANAVLPGEEIAANLCSGCHAVGRSGASPHPDALPFRKISMHYSVRSLEEALGEGILVGHPDMPPFQLPPEDIDNLLSYIESIQDPA